MFNKLSWSSIRAHVYAKHTRAIVVETDPNCKEGGEVWGGDWGLGVGIGQTKWESL